MFETKRSIFHSNKDHREEIHVYRTSDDSTFVNIEKKQTCNLTITLNLEEVCCIAKAFNVDQLKRQAEITDEQILKHVQEECDGMSKTMFPLNFYYSVYSNNVENLTTEERIKEGIKYYTKKRSDIRRIWDLFKTYSVYDIYFGLEKIK